MKTLELIHVLENYPDLPLFFEYRTGQFTRNDYHITEVKNVQFDTVDCGGVRNEWRETHIQLWENSVPEPSHSITAQKALKILDVVNRVRPTYSDTDVKVEYGNAGFHTAILPVTNVQIYDDKLIVQLTEDHTTCKAKDRATSDDERAAACCAPPAKTKLALSSIGDAACAPGSGCCS